MAAPVRRTWGWALSVFEDRLRQDLAVPTDACQGASVSGGVKEKGMVSSAAAGVLLSWLDCCSVPLVMTEPPSLLPFVRAVGATSPAGNSACSACWCSVIWLVRRATSRASERTVLSASRRFLFSAAASDSAASICCSASGTGVPTAWLVHAILCSAVTTQVLRSMKPEVSARSRALVLAAGIRLLLTARITATALSNTHSRTTALDSGRLGCLR